MSYFIIIRGPLGCGKTTIAKKVAKTLGAEYIAMDRIVDDHGLDADKEVGYISQRSFLQANTLALPRVVACLQAGQPVVFDGNFYWLSQIEDLLQKVQYPQAVFTLRAPLAVCIDRDSQRPQPHGPDAAEAVYKKSTEFDYGSLVDATKPVEESVKTILKSLSPKVK